MSEEKDLMSVREAAEYLRCSTKTLYNMIAANEIPHTTIETGGVLGIIYGIRRAVVEEIFEKWYPGMKRVK